MAIWLLATLGSLLFAGMVLLYLDRRDTRRAELVEDALAIAGQHGGVEVAAAITALMDLEYGAYGREHLRLVTEFAVANAKVKLVQAEVARQQIVVGELEQGTSRLRQSLRELPAVVKRRLP